ncbi:MAG TPA: thioredoxin family protein [Candidatus Obscuribacterales bacterium]
MRAASLVALLAIWLLGLSPAWCQEAASQVGGGRDDSVPELFVFDFYADWCASCVDVVRIVRKAEQRFAGRVKIIRVDIDEPRNRAFVKEVGVLAVPTLIVVNREGDRLKTLVGARQGQILDIVLQTLLPDSPPGQEPVLENAAEHPAMQPVLLK